VNGEEKGRIFGVFWRRGSEKIGAGSMYASPERFIGGGVLVPPQKTKKPRDPRRKEKVVRVKKGRKTSTKEPRGK